MRAMIPLWLMSNIIWTVIYITAILCLVVTYLHFSAKRARQHYTRQGITEMRGSDTFFVGSMLQLLKWKKAQGKLRQDAQPLKPTLQWLADQHDGTGKVNSYDFGANPNLLFCFSSKLHLQTSDPAMVQDMVVSKNALIDKTGLFARIFQNYFGNSFLFSISDDVWKKKRKAVAHAFYKDRLSLMVEVFKKIILETQGKWKNEIAANGGQTQIDLSSDILPIIQKFIVKVVMGIDHDPPSVDILKRINERHSQKFVMEKMSFSDAVDETFQQTMHAGVTRLINPLWRLINWYTGFNPAFNSLEKHANINCAALRTKLLEYVRKRVSGEEKSTLGDDGDLLSLMMCSPEIFTEDFMVDELIDFLTAGTQTSQYASQTIMAHFASDVESMEKVRAESAKVFQGDFEKLNLETTQELTYLSCVINEALRYNPPVAGTSHQAFERDTQAAGIEIKANHVTSINILGLHNNKSQWQRPQDFLPQRFDPTDPLALTPSGQKRHPMSFLPFNGGKRICFGKTFVEVTLKVMSAMIAQEFDLEFVEKEKYAGSSSLPMIMMAQSHYPQLLVKLTKRHS